jgi:hypothetical protein
MRVWISGPLVQILALAAAASGCTAASADSSTAAATTAKIDPKADQLLRKMSTSLAALNAFQFDADHALEVFTKANQKLQFIAQSRVSIQRPNKLRSDRIGAIADLSFFYDGTSMTIFGNRTKLYATTPAPNTLDAAIDFARDKIGVDAPAADMLYSDVYSGLMDNAETGAYIADEPVGNAMCHHLAYHAHDVDWQIWIEDSPRALPCRYVITSTDEPTQPEYEVQFSNWNVAPTLAATTFQFTPPRDATRIDFINVRDKAQQKARTP